MPTQQLLLGNSLRSAHSGPVGYHFLPPAVVPAEDRAAVDATPTERLVDTSEVDPRYLAAAEKETSKLDL